MHGKLWKRRREWREEMGGEVKRWKGLKGVSEESSKFTCWTLESSRLYINLISWPKAPQCSRKLSACFLLQGSRTRQRLLIHFCVSYHPSKLSGCTVSHLQFTLSQTSHSRDVEVLFVQHWCESLTTCRRRSETSSPDHKTSDWILEGISLFFI